MPLIASETFPVKGSPVDAQQPRGRRLVASREIEHPLDVPPFDGSEVKRLGPARCGSVSPADQRSQQLPVDRPVGQRDCPFDEILELAHVAWIAVGQQENRGIVGQRRDRNRLCWMDLTSSGT